MSSSPDIFEMILSSVETGAPVAAVPAPQREADWRDSHQEGQLAVDVYATPTELVLLSPMAGVRTGTIEVFVRQDVVTIRGERTRPPEAGDIEHVYHRECFWGPFSRTVILPVDVAGDRAHAQYENGVLTVRIPKQERHGKIPVRIVEE